MRCISFKAYQYKQPASADGEFMNKLTCKALVRVFLVLNVDKIGAQELVDFFTSQWFIIRSENEIILDFIRYQKLHVENSLWINLHFTAYMFNGLLLS